MNRLILAIAAVAALCPALEARAADVKAPVVAAPVLVVPAQDCSAFYDDYAVRGFGWGSGPGSSFGFGAFEGALNRYPPELVPQLVRRLRHLGALQRFRKGLPLVMSPAGRPARPEAHDGWCRPLRPRCGHRILC